MPAEDNKNLQEKPQEDRMFGKYRIIDELGRGGMGIVYKAEDTQKKNLVALKIPPKHISQNSLFVQRFLREAKTLAYLKHHNIVTILDSGQINGEYFIAQEYIQGVSVGRKMTEEKISCEKAIKYIFRICEALQYAHRSGVIHRDLKPANILVTIDDEIKIIDFGVAKVVSEATLTMTGSLLGTPAYMAPEQFVSAKTVDQRADIWSVGIILYEMVTKKLPFEGKTSLVMIKNICDQYYNITSPRKINSSVPLEIEKIIMKSLTFQKQKRYQSIDDMIAEIKGKKYQQEIIEYQFSKSYQIGQILSHPIFKESGTVTNVGTKETGLKYIVVDFDKKGLLKLVCELKKVVLK